MPGASDEHLLHSSPQAAARATCQWTAGPNRRAILLSAAAMAATLLAACETKRTVVSEGRRLDPTLSNFSGSYHMGSTGAGGDQAQTSRRSMLESREFRSAAPRNFRSPSRELPGLTEYHTQQSHLPQPSGDAGRNFTTRPASEQGGAFRQSIDTYRTRASPDQGIAHPTAQFSTATARDSGTTYRDGDQSEAATATPYRVDDTGNIQTLDSYNRRRSVPEVRRLLGKE